MEKNNTKVNPLISVILVNYNGKCWIEKCLNGLKAQTYPNFEIVFVDNASTDNSLIEVRNMYKLDNIKFVESKTNTGFATGNNLGISNSEGEYILLMNTDAWIENDFIENLYGFYLSKKYDVVAPIEVDYDSDTNKSLRNEYLSTLDIFGHGHFISNPTKETRNKFLFLSGACLFFSKKLYQDTGGLDNDFFMYFEDADWFWRLNLYGYSYNFARNVLFHHYCSGSTILSNNIKYNSFLWRNQNTLQMLLKNYAFPTLLLILPLYFFQNIIEMVFFTLILKPKIALSYIPGWWFNIKNIQKIISKRGIIQKRRLIGDNDIISRMYIGSGKFHHLINFIKKR